MWKCLRISVRVWCVLSFVSAAARAQAPETEPSPATPGTEAAPSTAAPEAPPPALPDSAAPPTPATAEPPPPAPPVESAPVEVAAADAPPDAPAPKPPPYSLPWQLRPVAAATVIRSDTAVAFYKNPSASPDDSSGTVIASMLLASLKLTPNFAPLLRLGIASNSPPTGDSATVFLNPVLGATYVLDPKAPLRVGLFLGLALPLGPGGDTIEPEDAAALGAGVFARSAMDNAMFATNYLTPFPGVGVAYVKDGLTVQGEATFLFLTRVRGGDHPVDSQDDLRVNFTTGLHVGYFFIPVLSAGAEIRYQRFLKHNVLSDLPDDDPNKANIDSLTFAVGPRLHFKLDETIWFRPGVAFAMGLDDPMSDREYKIVQIDLPLSF